MGKDRIITLTTDFGTASGYAGAMKGVILSINPKAKLVDITHDIESFQIIEAAFVINSFYRYYPFGSIHICVVDPGVGGERSPIIVVTSKHLFVGPDNGVFTFPITSESFLYGVSIENEKFFLPNLSSTFHGRDIFAPVAAHLSLGVSPKEFGDVKNDLVTIDFPKPSIFHNQIEGEIIHIDRFGNLITNIHRDMIEGKKISVEIKGSIIHGLDVSYSAKEKGEPICLIDSFSLLEIALVQKSAKEHFLAKVGDKVKVFFGGDYGKDCVHNKRGDKERGRSL